MPAAEGTRSLAKDVRWGRNGGGGAASGGMRKSCSAASGATGAVRVEAGEDVVGQRERREGSPVKAVELVFWPRFVHGYQLLDSRALEEFTRVIDRQAEAFCAGGAGTGGPGEGAQRL